MDSKITSKLPLYRRGKKNKISLRATFDGKQKWVALGTTLVREAESLARRFIQTEGIHGFEYAKEELYGKAIPSTKDGKVDFARIQELYDQYSGSQPDVRTKESSRKSYIKALKKMLDCTKVSYLNGINPDTLYLSWKSAYPTQSQDTYYTEIRKCNSLFKPKALAFYNRRGFPMTNPFADVELPKLDVSRYISLQPRSLYTEITQCKGLSSSQAMIVKLASMLGLRRGEIQIAQKSWVTDTAMIIPDKFGDWTPKGGRGRTMHVDSKFLELLLSLRGDSRSDFLVPGSGTNIADRLKPDLTFVCQWLRNLGIHDRKPLHLLRKEAGSVIATNHPQTIFAAKEWLGHASVTTTEKHYAHLVKTEPYNPLDYV